MIIGQRYVRTAPDGAELLVAIRNEAELKYHTELVTEGYTYKEVKIYKAPEECESCSA